MKVEVTTHKKYVGFLAVVDNKETNHLFDTEAKAFIYAGLLHSVSRNDADYLIRYISSMLDGLKEIK